MMMLTGVASGDGLIFKATTRLDWLLVWEMKWDLIFFADVGDAPTSWGSQRRVGIDQGWDRRSILGPIRVDHRLA